MGCSEDPDVKGTETFSLWPDTGIVACCSEDPDVKGTETGRILDQVIELSSCSEDPDVKGTETFTYTLRATDTGPLQRGSRCKGN